ncbi:MAG: LamG domain-containing protein, partial [Gammaproteobacteria bacterium]|nr:LamG domain-containing protein [Gammaproteobacteria bacterium]
EYTGPPPATAEVQSFKINVWDNLKSMDRCGACHTLDGTQAPMFVRQDDVNLAYSEATPYANLASPSESTLVSKVGGGHNCWEASDTACADIMTTWITAWAGDAVAGGGKNIELRAPVIKDPGSSKAFPEDPGLFASTVHPLLSQYCAACHSTDAQFPQQPYFGDASADVAYDAARQKINLDDPGTSRFVLRLGNEFHNCWGNCSADATVMQNAIEDFAASIDPTPIDPALVTSKALSLIDGIVASGGNRYESNAIATWEFKTGTGLTAFDTSGVEPALNLTLSGNVGWISGWGIQITDGKAQGSTTASKKLHDLIKATGEFSVEAWVVPGNVTQEEARIVSYSAGLGARNFTLGQTLYNYDMAVRSSTADANGMPALSTSDDDEDLQATLQHVVVTYDPVNGSRIFVNGIFTGDADTIGGGSLADWDDTFAFVLGNEVSGDRLWQGNFRLVSIHNRALTDVQIEQNYAAGVGEKFYLLFSVSHLVSVPDAYIIFEVSQFDNHSYLFADPAFISLDPAAAPDNITLKGIRIGINGVETPVGQAYSNLETLLNTAEFVDNRQDLSRLGALIAVQKGAEQDEFFLTFEEIGDHRNVFVDAVPLSPSAPPDTERPSDIGLRTFAEINASMAVATGISVANAAVDQTYQIIRQQLPTVESIEGFLASHQVAIAQLSIEYCNELVNSSALRTGYFEGFDFNASASAAFASSAERNLILNPLLANTVGADLSSQPDAADVRGELNALIDRLTACGSSCPSDRTPTVVKATCAAALGNAALLIQ